MRTCWRCNGTGQIDERMPHGTTLAPRPCVRCAKVYQPRTDSQSYCSRECIRGAVDAGVVARDEEIRKGFEAGKSKRELATIHGLSVPRIHAIIERAYRRIMAERRAKKLASQAR